MNAMLLPADHARSKLLCVILVIEPGATHHSGSNPEQLVIEKVPTDVETISMAGPTGFEPAISSVTGRRVRPATPRARGCSSRPERRQC